MTISGISSLAGITETKNNGGTIANDFDTFLQLLTTQLQNQNPLDPLDTNQFTQQLVQFAEVEQSLKANDQFASLLSFQSANAATAAVNYIGTTIRAEDTVAELANGSAIWGYDLAADASDSQVTIRNQSGAIVFSASESLSAGQHDYTWNGLMSNGGAAPDGPYTITIDAKDSNGNSIGLKTSVTGKVDGVDLSEAVPVLLIGTKRIELSSVTFVNGA